MTDVRHPDSPKNPPARRSVDELERELVQLETFVPSTRPVSQTTLARRPSITDLTAELDRLATEASIRAPSPPVRRTPFRTTSVAISDLPQAPAAPAPIKPALSVRPTAPPAPDDLADLPAIFGLGDEPEATRPAVVPAAPVRRSLPPPVPLDALEDRTLFMQLDAELLFEDDSVEEPDAPMHEPSALPEAETAPEIASLPTPSKAPDVGATMADLAAAFDSLPELADLQIGDMHEPSTEPKADEADSAEDAADLALLAARHSTPPAKP